MNKQKGNVIIFPKFEIGVKDFASINYNKGVFASFFVLGFVLSLFNLIFFSWIISFFSFLSFIESIIFFIEYNRIAKEKSKEIK